MKLSLFILIINNLLVKLTSDVNCRHAKHANYNPFTKGNSIITLRLIQIGFWCNLLCQIIQYVAHEFHLLVIKFGTWQSSEYWHVFQHLSMYASRVLCKQYLEEKTKPCSDNHCENKGINATTCIVTFYFELQRLFCLIARGKHTVFQKWSKIKRIIGRQNKCQTYQESH